MTPDVAALFVEPDGPYSEVDGVDLWPLERDARIYNRALPVVAHPPCARWSIASLCRGTRNGEDGGCFKSAIDSVRRCGGVLEHPALTLAWKRHGLTAPPRGGGWMRAGWEDDGFTVEVAQRHFGHKCTKRTWLYAVGINPLPSLPVGDGPPTPYGMSSAHKNGRRLSRRERILTPPDFRDLLISMARSVH